MSQFDGKDITVMRISFHEYQYEGKHINFDEGLFSFEIQSFKQ